MNVIPPAPHAATMAASAAGPAAEETDARLAGAFAALVEALTAQVDPDGAEGEALAAAAEPAAPAGETTETTDALPAELAVGPALLVWPTPAPAPTGEAIVVDTPAEVAPAIPVDVVPTVDAVAAVDVPDTADVMPPIPEDAPGEADATAPAAETEPAAETKPAVEAAAEAAPADAAEPDVVLPEVALVATAGGDTTGPDADGPVTPGIGSTGSVPARPNGEVTPAAQAAATRAPVPTLPDQLVEVIGPLRQAPDGTHRVSVQLRPDELGEVLVDVRVRGNEVSLSIRADLSGTADLLRDAVGELRAELESAGFRSGDVDVSSHPDRRATQDERRTGTSMVAEPAPSGAEAPTGSTPLTAASSGLDVRL